MTNNNDVWIAVDFDGTLAYYDGWKGPTVLGDPIPAMRDAVLTWLSRGFGVAIFTTRAAYPEAVLAIQAWCIKHLGTALEVTNIKHRKFKFFVDDRAIAVKRNAGCLWVPPAL
jgi:hypothetical protein